MVTTPTPNYSITTCEYHSLRWMELVEQGWVTFVVNGTTANMIYCPERGRDAR